MKQACALKMSKQLELGAVDLSSLEPVDKDLRPLRFKAYVNDTGLVKKNELPKEEEKGVHSVDSKG